MSAFGDIWYLTAAPPSKDPLMDRTCELIRRGRVIALKRADGYYLGQHTNIAAGRDVAIWGWRAAALHFDSLGMAFAIAPYFKARVVSFRVGVDEEYNHV